MIVSVTYFTKWMEPEPPADIKASNMEQFVWKSIISRFGMPKTIITDNEPRFNCKSFKEFCDKWRINLKFASSANHQINGKAKTTNKSIRDALKMKLQGEYGKRTEEIS